MIVYMLDNPHIGAACGVIEINEHLLEELDEDGHVRLDEDGNPIERKLSLFESALAKTQFLEYLNAFRLGRHYQSLINSEYMLSGAFSAFKRKVIKNLHYSELTVAEDFDISLDLHQQGVDVGFAPDAKVWVEPTTDVGSLYAQRLRWRRGQLEVMGVHKNMVGSNKYGILGRIGLPSMLMLDHTLAFPRIVWTFILLLFPLFGYSSRVVALFFVMLYVFHVIFDMAQTLAAFVISDKDTHHEIERAFQYVLILPFFRLLVFYFRMSGYLVVFKEPQKWKVSTPLSGVRQQVATVQHRIDGGARNVVSFLYSVFYIFRT
jgi:cellulose synthase/poly-beta-1,6-N-acetylglucosamine synthase-like glycosyltransferase